MRISPLLPALVFVSLPFPAHVSQAADPGEVDPVASYNYVVGTQTFRASYQFTDEHWLVETAKRILEMGSNTLKFRLSWEPKNNLPLLSPPAESMAELARRNPHVKAVLDMPFYYYFMWTKPTSAAELKIFDPAAKEANYREMFELTKYLLETYNGTGKTFYLGQWEGDGIFAKSNHQYIPTEAETRNAIEWANNRQQAVTDARKATPHQDVEVFYYVEVNYVWDARNQKPRMTNAVLPHAPLDYVAYSCYEAVDEKDMRRLKQALDFIQDHAKFTPLEGIESKRLFIGEFGFPAFKFKPEEQAEWTRATLRAGLEWGCPFILYWEMYNNEVRNGKQLGYWLINDKNEKTPAYFVFEKFLKQAREYVADFHARERRVPTSDEYRKQAVKWLE